MERTLAYAYWSRLSRLPDEPQNYTNIRLDLTGETRLSLAQRNFPGEASYEHWNFYWNMALERIRKLAET